MCFLFSNTNDSNYGRVGCSHLHSCNSNRFVWSTNRIVPSASLSATFEKIVLFVLKNRLLYRRDEELGICFSWGEPNRNLNNRLAWIADWDSQKYLSQCILSSNFLYTFATDYYYPTLFFKRSLFLFLIKGRQKPTPSRLRLRQQNGLAVWSGCWVVCLVQTYWRRLLDAVFETYRILQIHNLSLERRNGRCPGCDRITPAEAL